MRDEGVRSTVYLDTKGNVTFGVGHKGSTPLSQAAISRILTDDIMSHSADVLAVMPWTHALSLARFNVLVNMCFNLGITKLLTFKNLIEALQTALDTNSDDYGPAADAMRHSLWADEVGERAERLAIQMETDKEQ
jgi:lysozyme